MVHPRCPTPNSPITSESAKNSSGDATWLGSALPSIVLAEPDDISDGVLWLASDLSRTVTGTQLTLDMGATKV